MIFFRADGNSDIGSGHVMRCLSIAMEAALTGTVLFVTADESFTQTIRSVGVHNHVLHTDYWNLPSELRQMQDLVLLHHPSVLFIDSYFVTAPYLNALRVSCKAAGCKLVYIDDVLAFPYPCDVLLNYNIYGPDRLLAYQQMYREGGIAEPQFLLGTGYAPLRPEFQNLPDRKVREKASEILISTGGADPEHLALQLAEEISDRSVPYHFHFIIGSMNGDGDAVAALAARSGKGNILLHHNVTAMQHLMQKMDLAISAAGSTLYELCATQTPALTYILADNQIPGAQGFQNHNVLNCAGDYRTEPHFIRKLINAALVLAEDYDERKRIVADMRGLVDGKGARRILEAVAVPACGKKKLLT